MTALKEMSLRKIVISLLVLFLILISLLGLKRQYGKEIRWNLDLLIFKIVQGNYRSLSKSERKNVWDLPKFIAHAGGGIGSDTYTNSLEALQENYKKGFKVFEIDIEWTSDEELVLVHDWHLGAFGINSEKCLTLAEFRQLRRVDGRTPLTLSQLVDWLKQKSDAFIVTDIKRLNVSALKLIAIRFPNVVSQIIPQIYRFTEFKPVQDLGYKTIIFTNYMAEYPEPFLLEFLNKCDVAALAARAGSLSPVFENQLQTIGIPFFFHTVNVPTYFLSHPLLFGIYTDFISP